jgi:hypothetical protein
MDHPPAVEQHALKGGPIQQTQVTAVQFLSGTLTFGEQGWSTRWAASRRPGRRGADLEGVRCPGASPYRPRGGQPFLRELPGSLVYGP